MTFPVTTRPGPAEATHYRFVYLLAAQLGLVVLYPFIAGDRPRPGLGGAFALAVLAAALWAVARERRIRVVAALLAAPAIAREPDHGGDPRVPRVLAGDACSASCSSCSSRP